MMQGRIGIDKSERIPRRGRPDPQSKNKSDGKVEAPKLNESGQLTDEEVAKRRSGSGVAKEVVLGDVRGDEEGWVHASYAVMTQRGYHVDREYLLIVVS